MNLFCPISSSRLGRERNRSSCLENCSCRGFTLLELLVSITLMAVVVTVAAMVFRTGLVAFERRVDTNRDRLSPIALGQLLGTQLNGLLSPEDAELKRYLHFDGRIRELGFVTDVTPLGTGKGGMAMAIYRFEPDRKLVVYAQKVITRPDDLKARLPEGLTRDDAEKMMEQGWICDFLPVAWGRFSYLSRAEEATVNPSGFSSSRHKADRFRFRGQYPASVTLEIKPLKGEVMTFRYYL